MPTYRYPTLIVHDAAGTFTALPIDAPDGLAGFGATPAAALAQVREFLGWVFRRTGILPEPDFREAQLATLKVMIRPSTASAPGSTRVRNRCSSACRAFTAGSPASNSSPPCHC